MTLKNNKFYLLISILLLMIISCANGIDDANPHKSTAQKALSYLLKNSREDLMRLITDEAPEKADTEGIFFYIDQAKGLFEKYGVPSEKHWYLEYDTTHPIVKLEQIVIPIYKGYDENNRLEEASLKLGFDYTRQYIPDTMIANFKLYTRYRPVGKNR